MSTAIAVIKKRGAWLEVTEDGQRSLPPDVLGAVQRELTYKRHINNFAANRYNHQVPIVTQPQRLYDYYEGRFFCMQGHFWRIRQLLTKLGRRVIVLNKDPLLSERPRPNCYEQDWDRVYSQFQFRPGQEDCLRMLALHDMGVVDAVPAFGKMWLIAMLCALYPHAKIDVVTYRKDVADSIYQLLTKYIPAIGRVGGGRTSPALVTVYTAGSLQRARMDADILIADEVHELCTDKKMEFLTAYDYARMYAFTASRNTRTDNDWHRIEMVFGPTIYTMDYPTAEGLGLVASVMVQWLEIPAAGEDPIAGYEDPVAQKRHGIWRNDIRNQKIAQVSHDLKNSGLQVLILVDTIDHALHLRRYLPDFELCYAEGSMDAQKEGYYRSHGLMQSGEPEMTTERREELRARFERRELTGVIATGVWAVGVSFTGLDVLVRANGGTSKTENIQLPGRVCRIDAATGKQMGIVVDCMDRFNPTYENRSKTRRTAYAKQGWIQYQEDGTLWQPGYH